MKKTKISKREKKKILKIIQNLYEKKQIKNDIDDYGVFEKNRKLQNNQDTEDESEEQ